MVREGKRERSYRTANGCPWRRSSSHAGEQATDYRRNQTSGTWVLRIADGRGGSSTEAIGFADDHDEPDGHQFLDYWQAQERAKITARRQGEAVDFVSALTSTPVVSCGASRRKALKAAEGEDLFSKARRTLVALLFLHRSFRVTTTQGSSQGPHSAISIYRLLINC